MNKVFKTMKKTNAFNNIMDLIVCRFKQKIFALEINKLQIRLLEK